MGQQPLEMILMRQLAGYLSIPIFLVDPQGTLLFYNESAEPLLGSRFHETGAMPIGTWATMFAATDETGVLMPHEQLPLSHAINKLLPSKKRLHFQGLDHVERVVDVVAFPLIGLKGTLLGAAALFWEVSP